MISDSRITDLRRTVWRYYRFHKRSMPWRETCDPYAIFLSEVMLQQTQVGRVSEKYREFIALFPDFAALAAASPAAVVRAWQGLGYNRRALFLHRAAQQVIHRFEGELPRNLIELESLPGVGPATARSIAAFAFNVPVVFIETNIRRVFIHHFFAGRESVSDQELLPLVAVALPERRAREWYWALMDYGAYLARQLPNPNRRSRHYVRQSAFIGSRREVRGRVLRLLVDGALEETQLADALRGFSHASKEVIEQLIAEGFIERTGTLLRLKR